MTSQDPRAVLSLAEKSCDRRIKEMIKSLYAVFSGEWQHWGKEWQYATNYSIMFLLQIGVFWRGCCVVFDISCLPIFPFKRLSLCVLVFLFTNIKK